MTHTELLYALALQRTPHIGDITAKKLIAAFNNSIEAVYKTPKHQLLNIDGIGTYTIKELHNPAHLKAAERELHAMHSHNIRAVYFLEDNYPKRLKHCVDSPILLFYKGNADLNAPKCISIVGTRKITSYGKSFLEQLISELAPLNPTIVSGFAFGVDITAQKLAIKHGLQTIGCMAHGLDSVYPKAHAAYVKDVLSNGGFVSDFWTATVPDRENFLKRNRIIAGLSEATIVIESAEKGGSLVTANIANSYNREVFALPGRATDSHSVGCNNLIKKQAAHMITQAADIVYMLGWELNTMVKNTQKKLFVSLNDIESQIHSYLVENGKSLLDVIALECKIPIHQTTTLLLQMELKGAVRPLPGKIFEAI